MNATDLDLLSRYTRQHVEDAFAEIVRRHLDLVYSAAFRQVRSTQLAEEVAQSAFTDLARDAHRLAPNTILTAWLYQVTRRTAIDLVRREARRQLREQIASEMNATNATAADWSHIEPLLDEAMAALEATDRAAVLLRYFENKSLHEVGQQLGVSDDAAQKRVSRAVERLRQFFAKRGVTVGASGLVVLITANAVQAAPVGLAVTISAAAALAGATLTTTATVTATKAIAMTTLQKTIIGAALATAVGTGIFEARQASRLHDENLALRQQQAPLTEQIQDLQRERNDATNRLALLADEIAQNKNNNLELLKLRGELTRLKSQNAAIASGAADSALSAATSLLERVNKLKQKLDEKPEAKIPELQLLTDSNWIEATKGNLKTETDFREAFSYLRDAGERRFLDAMQTALQRFFKANNDQFPTDLSQLKPYFESPPNDEVLQRYKIVSADSVASESMLAKDGKSGESVIALKAVIDEENDAQYTLGRNGLGAATYQFAQAYSILAPAIQALTAAAPTNENGRVAFDISQLLPYLTTPEQKAAYYRLTHHKNPDSR